VRAREGKQKEGRESIESENINWAMSRPSLGVPPAYDEIQQTLD
jgi:hypothetical protein